MMQKRIVQAVTLPLWWVLNRVSRAARRRRSMRDLEAIGAVLSRGRGAVGDVNRLGRGGVVTADMLEGLGSSMLQAVRAPHSEPIEPLGVSQVVGGDSRPAERHIARPCFTCGEDLPVEYLARCCHPRCHGFWTGQS